MISLSLVVLPIFAGNSTPLRAESYHIQLKEFVVTAQKTTKHSSTKSFFLNFKTERGLDTSIDSSLVTALNAYTGPEVTISSLKRHKWNSKSKHRIGRAADFEFNPELIEWLVSEEGSLWRTQYGINFFIEGKPGSKLIKSYKRGVYEEFVFENPYATGDHIHIDI